MIFRTGDLLVRQRTYRINVLRGDMGEFGLVVPPGVSHVGRLTLAYSERHGATSLSPLRTARIV